MRVWMHRETGGIVLATEQWEPIHIKYDESLYNEIWPPDMLEYMKGKKMCHGTMLQVGWLIQNAHDVWLGVGLKAQEAFEDLGEP